MEDSSPEQVERANRRVPLLLDLTQLRVIHQAGIYGVKVSCLIFVQMPGELLLLLLRKCLNLVTLEVATPVSNCYI